MKRIVGLSVILLVAGVVRAESGSAKSATDARHLARSGNWAEAAEIYDAKARDEPTAAVGLARCLEARGKRREAAAVLAACRNPDAAVQAEAARLALARGDPGEARRRVEVALRLAPEQLLARWLSGELYRAAGRLKEAEAAYAWLVHYYNDHDVEDVESLRWIGLAAAQYARWNRLGDQFQFLVGDLYPDALEREPDFWPAALEMGLLYLEKFNEAEAARWLRNALNLNPHAAEVHAALAQLHLIGRDVEAAQSALNRVLELNPESLAGWRLRAQMHWANFDPDEAAHVLREKAMPLDPTDEETLGALAACHAILDGAGTSAGPSRLNKLIDEVNARNPRAGVFYFTLGSWLADRHKFRPAEQFLREARRRMPRLVGPEAELALLCMAAGREDEAKTLLEAAMDADPFNLRTANMLKLCDVLGAMKTVETEHVIVRYDAKRDAMLARYAVDYIEATCVELCKQFDFTPPRKPLVEIFGPARGLSGSAWFATRMTGLPYVGTVAASTGHMVGMVSSSDPSGARCSWAQVLRHELVHVVTLQQTDFAIPHWFTEALAVHAEGTPRPHRWNEILRRRAAVGKLFALDTINFGFTRPHSGEDWHLAYCQAELYLDYMLARHGADAPRRLLAAYAAGLDTPRALRRALGVSPEEFERGYARFVREQVAGLSGLVHRRPGKPLENLLAEHRKSPEDAETAAELALTYFRRGAWDEAAELARDASRSRPDHPLAGYVQAQWLLRQKKREEAIDLLARCLDRVRPQADVLELLANLRLRTKDLPAAAELFELGNRLEPGNPAWLRGLACVHRAAKDDKQLEPILAELARRDSADVTSRKRLARMALARGDFASAARWARQGLEIDVQDARFHGSLAEALAGLGRDAEAIDEFQIALELDPEARDLRLELARVLLRAGRKSQARQTLKRLLEESPEDPVARSLLKSLEEDDGS